MNRIATTILLSLAAAAPVFADAPASAPSPPVAPQEQQTLADLANQGQSDDLERAFSNDNIPDDQRAVYRAFALLNRLQNEKNLPPSTQRELLDQAVNDLDKGLIYLSDPQVLANEAQILAAVGVDAQTEVLEYWGRGDAQEAILRPPAQTAVKIFDQANRFATAAATDIANRITSPDDKLGDAWQKMNDLAGSTAYQKARMQYSFALSLDIADPRRGKLIQDALASFSQWDNADSGIQPQVRLLMAKLHTIAGSKSEWDAGEDLINSLLNDPDHKISPQPTHTLLFETRCYEVIANLEIGNAAGASGALDDATADQKANFADDAVQAATLRLLNYRLLALRADQSPPADQRAANDAAVAALGQVIHDFPNLRTLIYQQLSARLPAKPDVTQLDPLLLGALVDQGRQLVLTTSATQFSDSAKLQLPLAAAKELVDREAAGKIPAPQAVQASLLIGIFEQYLGDPFSAADSLLDHIQRFGNDPDANAAFALDRARDIIADLRQTYPVDPHGRLDPRIQHLQDRFLPIAINPPFNRHEFALQYAASLLSQGQNEEAIKYYHMVADTESPSQVLAARYGEMVALKNELDEGKLSADQRLSDVDQIQQLAHTVNDIGEHLIKNSDSDREKTQAKSTLARTSLLAADITRREGNDPQRVLELLDGFEDRVQGLPDAKLLLNGALFLRVQSFMQLGRNNDATKTLVQYLSGTGGSEGAQTVHDLLAVLNRDLDQARAQAEVAAQQHDSAGEAAAEQSIHQLAANRAMLSGFLVQWADDGTDPKIHAYAYTYRRFDADAKRTAAELEQDPATRQKDLTEVMQLYRDLQSPDNFALYQASLDPVEGIDRNYPDPLVTLGVGLTAYDLGDCQTVKQTLGTLIHDQKLGDDNDQYWEASYKLISCMHTLAKSGDPNTTDAQVEQSLKILYLIWHGGTGGPKWHGKFEQLRQEILPDWTVPSAGDGSQG